MIRVPYWSTMSPQTSNLSNEEFVRLFGHLSKERAEALIDEAECVPNGEDAGIYIREARHPFSAEDFLSDAISLAAELKLHCRGENKKTAERLHAMLEDIAQTTFNAMEYSDEQLIQALSSLGLKP